MFTGIVEELGTVRAVLRTRREAHLCLVAGARRGLRVGDSLAVDGVCLTVTSLASGAIAVTAVAETLARTTLHGLRSGSRVNLERARRLGDRLGGHLVQGHVDAVGTVRTVVRRGASVEMTFAAPAGVMRYVIEKGSITVDGVSLTVAARTRETFRVALVPHTLAVTTLGLRRRGDRVNLEADMVGKYLEQLVAPRARRQVRKRRS